MSFVFIGTLNQIHPASLQLCLMAAFYLLYWLSSQRLLKRMSWTYSSASFITLLILFAWPLGFQEIAPSFSTALLTIAGLINAAATFYWYRQWPQPSLHQRTLFSILAFNGLVYLNWSLQLQVSWLLFEQLLFIEAACLMLVCRFYHFQLLIFPVLSLYITGGIYLLNHGNPFDWQFGDQSFLLGLIAMVSTAIGAFACRGSTQQEQLRCLIFTVLTTSMAVPLIWVTCHNFVEPKMAATALALICYASIGVGLLYCGIKGKKNTLSAFGYLTIGAVILRLLTIDLWEMTAWQKMVTCAAIGVLLIGTPFFRRRA